MLHIPTPRGPRRPAGGPRPIAAPTQGRTPALALALALVLTGAPAHSAVPLDPETEQLLVEAVEAAAALDFYNARCRSDRSGRHLDNLNKELVSKLRLTVITVQDDLFPEGSYRAAQARMQEDFINALREAGGCKAAKDGGLRERLQADYRQKLEAVEDLP